MIDRRDYEASIHKLLTDVIPLGIFLCDTQGRISGWTGSATSMTRLTEDEVVGQSFQALFRPAKEQEVAPWASGLPGSAANYREVVFARRKDGSEFLAVFTMDRLSDHQGVPVGYACTLGAL
jgi:PAS domain S-box-containing protein